MRKGHVAAELAVGDAKRGWVWVDPKLCHVWHDGGLADVGELGASRREDE